MDERGENDAHRNSVLYAMRTRRAIRDIVEVFRLPDALFIQTYRLSKQLVRQLVQELTPYLRPDHHGNAISQQMKVLCALNFYATGSYQASVASNWMYCLGRSTVGRFIHEVAEALNHPAVQRRWIHFPETQQEMDHLSEKHQREFNIPGVVGFIDGTEVTVVTPFQTVVVNPQVYWTHKKQYALNCEITCDSDLLILNMNASHPGSSHDAFIYAHSAVRRKMKEAFERSPSHWLLGDSGYPLEPWLLTPILDAEEGSPEAYFTECHCKARCCVERCIGVLKARFRCLLRASALYYSPLFAGKIVKACCVLLHNMCRKVGIPHDEYEFPEGEEDPRPWVQMQVEAELEAIEEEEEADPELVVEDANVRAVGNRVRQRILEFLNIQQNIVN